MTAAFEEVYVNDQREISELREMIVAGDIDAALDLVQRLHPGAYHLPRRHFETIIAARRTEARIPRNRLASDEPHGDELKGETQ